MTTTTAADMIERLKGTLEPILASADPRRALSAYHDMPYALFRYHPGDEFELRRQVTDLQKRLENGGKQVHRISLAECLDAAMTSQDPLPAWFAMEREQDTATLVKTVHNVLADDAPLTELVARRMPADVDPLRDLVFILRTGALFPVYRTFSLLEQLQGRVVAPSILFYPGTEDGVGLSFMGVLQPEHNYRPKIF